MIKHYLKVALRNLMNFKVHSLISAICLAIGITCFSMMNYFIDAITGKVELSDNNKYSIRLSGASSQTAADIYLFKEDFDYLKELPIAGIDTLVASSSLGILLTSFSISAISANCSNVVLRCSLPLELKSSAA